MNVQDALRRFTMRGCDAINAAEFTVLCRQKLIVFDKKTREWKLVSYAATRASVVHGTSLGRIVNVQHSNQWAFYVLHIYEGAYLGRKNVVTAYGNDINKNKVTIVPLKDLAEGRRMLGINIRPRRLRDQAA